MDHKPAPKLFRERIGNTEYELEERKLDVFEEVKLWDHNPRLMAAIGNTGGRSETQLEAALKGMNGYSDLAR
jgi:hypothetical protein